MEITDKELFAKLGVPDLKKASKDDINALYKKLLELWMALEKEIPEVYYKSLSNIANRKLLAKLNVTDLKKASKGELKLLREKLLEMEKFKDLFSEPGYQYTSLSVSGICAQDSGSFPFTPLKWIEDLCRELFDGNDVNMDNAVEKIRVGNLEILRRILEMDNLTEQGREDIKREMKEIEIKEDKKDTETKMWLLGVLAGIIAEPVETFIEKEN